MTGGPAHRVAPATDVLFGASPIPPAPQPATGRMEERDREQGYRIDHAEALPPFLVSVVGDSDAWLFAASNGALTAGRRSPRHALFPYVTEDKLYDSAEITGPSTTLVAERGGRRRLWRPLHEADRLVYRVARRLWKSALGHHLVLEEENADLGLRFELGWRTSGRFGCVRECALVNLGPSPVEIRVLDGLLNLLPSDVEEPLQLGFSCLVDAYKRTERDPSSRLALYTLAAQMTDLPEPRESLHATAVWSHGLEGARVILSARQVEAFRRGEPLEAADEVRGERGAYLLEGSIALAPGATARWLLVADVHLPQRAVADLRVRLREPDRLVADLRADLDRGAERLRRIVAATDGLQLTGDPAADAHHLANVLFNDLRGGVPAAGNDVPGRDLAAFVRRRNRTVAARHAGLLASLADREPILALSRRLAETGDLDLERLGLEYLPLTFGRRHGDPSRPWNRFEIRVRDDAGAEILHYEGNWRDVFQNWEALSLSHPEYLEHLVARFVNGSTLDGHNPCRISKDGIDWEVPDPDQPWAGIGYWGDHQLVYLLRLLRRSLAFHPERLRALLQREIFSYADVPYRIAPYAGLLADPRRTVTFDAAAHARILARVAALGEDGRLVQGADGVHRATLVEKLLVPALAKLANLVPGGGVWMNTQRPEWNDANNALAGFGLSVVTTCHLERYLAFLADLLAPLRGRQTILSAEVAAWAEGTLRALRDHAGLLDAPAVGEGERASFLESVGAAASAYRAAVYARGITEKVAAPVDPLLDLLALGAAFARDTVARSRRGDGLHHSYCLLAPRSAGAGLGVEHLPEMLEGQVAVLGTGALDHREACDLLDALRASRLWAPDRRSYLLYPDRALPRFLEKNVIPDAALAASPLLTRLAASGEGGVLARDAEGRLRFDERLHDARRLRERLLALREAGAPDADDGAVEEAVAVHEQVFRHRAFTGRSGTMFAYEGLGSVYWHMVAKLLVAVQERLLEAAEGGADPAVLRRLEGHYREIRAGLGGLRKSPAEYGAFPLDPYSHSPAGGGARQPGMTGQVKEEILTRAGELGVAVRDGRIAFRPRLLRPEDLLRCEGALDTFDVAGRPIRLTCPAGTLAFTVCQVPVVYHVSADRRIVVEDADGATSVTLGDALDAVRSRSVFAREGRIRRIDVYAGPLDRPPELP